jgi:hypothetical protein
MLFLFSMLFSGCRRNTNFEPAVEKIAEVSRAAGFLAKKVEESGGFISSLEKKSNEPDHAYVYDNSLAVIVLSFAGAHQHARTIADALLFAQQHDRTFNDGRLRNAYLNGDPKSDSGRSITAGKIKIRLPGFWKDGRWQEDSFVVSTSTGNMAWALLAFCAVAENAGPEQREEYLAAAVRAADFLLGLKSESGGFTAGYEGWDDTQKKVTYKSTEHNIDLICAFKTISNALKESDSEKSRIYMEASDYAKEFVHSMYDSELHCFYTGTGEDGKTISKGVIPLDTNTLTILAIGDELVNADKMLLFVEKNMAVGEGFDFSNGDLDGIWNEGTAQMAVCYNLLGYQDKYTAVMEYLKTQIAKDGSIPAADRDGVSTGFVVIGTEIYWEYHNSQSIGATGWLAFAQMGRNPFEITG